jgi:hypothetical protein
LVLDQVSDHSPNHSACVISCVGNALHNASLAERCGVESQESRSADHAASTDSRQHPPEDHGVLVRRQPADQVTDGEGEVAGGETEAASGDVGESPGGRLYGGV